MAAAVFAAQDSVCMAADRQSASYPTLDLCCETWYSTRHHRQRFSLKRVFLCNAFYQEGTQPMLIVLKNISPVISSLTSIMAFTFAAFCYIVALVLSAVLIFFVIFHVSDNIYVLLQHCNEMCYLLENVSFHITYAVQLPHHSSDRI